MYRSGEDTVKNILLSNIFKCAVTLKGSGNNRESTRVGGLTLPEVFTREKVNPLARVTLARR